MVGKLLEDKGITDRERFEIVKMKAKQFEDKAKLDELLLKPGSNKQ